MATGKQNRDFEGNIFDDVNLLDKAVAWIRVNMSADQVFDKDELRDWAGDNSKPEEVFDVADLEAWATENGFVKF